MDSNNNDLELIMEDLKKNVQAGNSQGMSEASALEHLELFRTSQIEKLQQELDENTEEKSMRR